MAAAAIALALAWPALAGATVASDLCTGNPCVISGSKVVDAGSEIDFGATTNVRLAGNATVTVGPSAVLERTISLTAKSFTFQPGAKMLGGGDAAIVNLTSTGGNIELKRQGTSFATINLSGTAGGSIWLSANGDAIIDGDLNVGGSGSDSSGGSISIGTTGAVTVNGLLKAGASGSFSTGGDIDIDAGTSATLSGTIDVAAKSDAGTISIFASMGPATINSQVAASGGAPDGYGGTLSVDATFGDVTIGGKVVANGGSGTEDQCGDGGTLTISSGLSVAINEDVQLKGGTQCLGGTLEVVADGAFTQAAGKAIALNADGSFGGGGSFNVDAFGDVLVRKVDLFGRGYGGGADIDSASGLVSMAGIVDARGTGSNGSVAGTIDVQGCSVQVTSQLDARGTPAGIAPGTGIVALTASDSITVTGSGAKLLAQVGNLIRMRSGAPVINGGAQVVPAQNFAVDPNIKACAAKPVCGNGVVEATEYCDDGPTTGTPAGCCAAGCQTSKGLGASCDDGVFCNGADTCGFDDRCSQHAGDPCAGLTGACVSGTCSESLHCGVAPNTACDDADGNPCTTGQCSPAGTCAPQPAAGSCDDGDGNPCTTGQCNAGACTAIPFAGSCDDGTFCNGAEICIEGKCRRMQRECPKDSCDEGGGECEAFCGDGIAQGGEQCGDGELPACPAGSTCRNCMCEASTFLADSYVCYAAVPSASPPWQFKPVQKEIGDRIERKTFDITAFNGVCSPAVIGSAQGTFLPAHPELGHARHAMVQSTVPAPQAPFVHRNETVTDRFGSVQVTLQAANALLVRSKIVDFGPIVPCAGDGECTGGDTCQLGVCLPNPAKAEKDPPANNVKVDNYKCYKAVKIAGTPFKKPKKLRVTDGFGQPMLFDVQKVLRVCAPASLGTANAAAPAKATQLTCYEVKPSGSAPKQADFEPRSMGLTYRQFPKGYVDALVPKEICVPSNTAPLP
jgi:hypothetical protein